MPKRESGREVGLAGQQDHWDAVFAAKPAMFGDSPSDAARAAADAFTRAGTQTVLELGAGQGRDTFHFAQNGFKVTAVDYSQAGVKAIAAKAAATGVCHLVTPLCHDIRTHLPFDDAAFDACYSHMLFCMAFSMDELRAICGDVRRVLTPGALHIYTVRTTDDPQCGAGIARGPGMFELHGFVVRFFDEATVRQLAEGFELLSLDRFEETALPRRLFRVTLRKQ